MNYVHNQHRFIFDAFLWVIMIGRLDQKCQARFICARPVLRWGDRFYVCRFAVPETTEVQTLHCSATVMSAFEFDHLENVIMLDSNLLLLGLYLLEYSIPTKNTY